MKQSEINFKKLWKIVTKNKVRINSHIHGPEHWARVERNGLYICEKNGADKEIIKLFALFHDSMRLNDGRDIEHGLRGAEYAKSLLNKEYELAEDKFELLYYACQYHSIRRPTEDKTIGTCWDADRLDLRRVGIKPDEKYLYSDAAKIVAREQKWNELNTFKVTFPLTSFFKKWWNL
ncbi:HD domain-containing protein [Candidatus Halobeggiatoa sp. HSG11]|nr:HD domain-containing protein [Candidatus Halobeggiatoa sp. HSG11]